MNRKRRVPIKVVGLCLLTGLLGAGISASPVSAQPPNPPPPQSTYTIAVTTLSGMPPNDLRNDEAVRVAVTGLPLRTHIAIFRCAVVTTTVTVATTTPADDNTVITLSVRSTAGFPNAGEITVPTPQPGMPNATSPMAYTGTTPNMFTGVTLLATGFFNAALPAMTVVSKRPDYSCAARPDFHTTESVAPTYKIHVFTGSRGGGPTCIRGGAAPSLTCFVWAVVVSGAINGRASNSFQFIRFRP
jgi:hypothetical protein